MKTETILADVRARRDENGVATIRSKEVAVLVRARLKTAFPGFRFSVRSDYNTVDIHWTDGPTERLVEPHTKGFSFGGFDGMIDLAFDGSRWLLPDGTMRVAHCLGTEGSGGTVPAVATDCPAPGAFMVKYGPRYVFCHRSVSHARYAWLASASADYYDLAWDPTQPIWNQSAKGDYLTTWARKWERLTEERIGWAALQERIGCAVE